MGRRGVQVRHGGAEAHSRAGRKRRAQQLQVVALHSAAAADLPSRSQAVPTHLEGHTCRGAAFKVTRAAQKHTTALAADAVRSTCLPRCCTVQHLSTGSETRHSCIPNDTKHLCLSRCSSPHTLKCYRLEGKIGNIPMVATGSAPPLADC